MKHRYDKGTCDFPIRLVLSAVSGKAGFPTFVLSLYDSADSSYDVFLAVMLHRFLLQMTPPPSVHNFSVPWSSPPTAKSEQKSFFLQYSAVISASLT